MSSEDLTWGGVPADAEPPRRRASWAQRDQAAPPVGRDQSPVHTPTPVDPPNWSPIVTDNNDSSAFAAHMAGDGHPEDPFSTAGTPDSVFSDPEPFVSLPPETAHPEPGHLVDHAPNPFQAPAGFPAPPHQPVAAPPEPAPEPQPVPAVEPQPDNIFNDPGAEADPETTDEPAGNEQDTGSLLGLFSQASDDNDHTLLPERAGTAAAPSSADSFVAPQAPAPVTAAEEQPLSTMFGPAADSPPDAPVYATRTEATAAYRAQLEQQRLANAATPSSAAEQTAEHRALAYRYTHAARLEEEVKRLLSLAQTGDAKLTGLLNSFSLTRDKDIDAQQRAQYEAALTPLMRHHNFVIGNPADAATIFSIAYDELIGIGPLGPLWRDDDVTEIMVSGPDKVTVERNGELVRTPVKYIDKEHLKRTARKLAGLVDDRIVSRSIPLVTAQLPGARVQFALDPVAPVAGASITIRKFRPLFGLNDLLSFGALDTTMAHFLKQAVESRATILVSGGTGSGKTTMINALSEFIPDNERVVTIEDAQELSLTNSHVETLLTKEAASGDDKIIIGQDDLLRASLRMRPDRIIVGEIRDSAGCYTMMQAANTGHDGTMTTVHANDPRLAIRRLTQFMRGGSGMPDAVAREEVMMAFDLIVQVVRVRGRRFVSHISLVNSVDSTGPATTEIFVGRYPAGAAAPEFSMANPLGSDTELAARMTDVGIDPTIWSAQR